jgi:hypothetical protein
MDWTKYVNGFGVEDGPTLVEAMRSYAGKYNFREVREGRFSFNVNSHSIDCFNYSGIIQLVERPDSSQPAAELMLFSPSGSADFIKDGFHDGALQWQREFERRKESA